MASGTIRLPLVDVETIRFPYKNGVSMNTLTTSGMYYCESCTNAPNSLSGVTWGTYELEVIGSGGTAVKQIARPIALDGYCFERHLVVGTWSSWAEVGRTIPFVGDTSTFKYIRKPADPSYGSFIITGTLAGLGGVMIAVRINNGSINDMRNLMTGTAWSDSNASITYGIDGGVGWIGIKTTSNVGSNVCIIGG